MAETVSVANLSLCVLERHEPSMARRSSFNLSRFFVTHCRWLAQGCTKHSTGLLVFHGIAVANSFPRGFEAFHGISSVTAMSCEVCHLSAACPVLVLILVSIGLLFEAGGSAGLPLAAIHLKVGSLGARGALSEGCGAVIRALHLGRRAEVVAHTCK